MEMVKKEIPWWGTDTSLPVEAILPPTVTGEILQSTQERGDATKRTKPQSKGDSQREKKEVRGKVAYKEV